MVVFVMIYLFFWLSAISKVQKEIVRVRSMILMIPLDVCQSLKSIRELVSAYFETASDENKNIFDN